MSVIQRAADRMREKRQESLVERAAAAASVETPGTVEPAPALTSVFPPRTGADSRLEAIPPAPVAPVPPVPPVHRSREIELDFRLLGSRGFITPSGRQSRLAEEIRLIKRRLTQRTTLFAQNDQEANSTLGHVILVTSSGPQEGKSFIALNLALSFALDDGLDALLIDADIQRPSVLKSLGMSPKPGQPPLLGLADLLRDPQLNMADVLLRDRQLRLSVLPAGRPMASATNLFAQERTRLWIAEMARRYSDRIIIFDAPPILARTEPLALSNQVGQILLVVEAGKTSSTTLRATLNLLAPADNISLILNKMLTFDSQSRFGRYYNEYTNG